MKTALIQEIENKYLSKKIPQFRAGDNIKLHLRILEEGKKERIQIFEGVVLRAQGGGSARTVTVRKVVDGVGVEKTVPVFSPSLAKIEVMKYGKVRRSKLYYLRDLIGSKVTRVKEDMQKNIAEATEKAKVRKETEAKQREEKATAKKVAAAAPAPEETPKA
jgi:large subunit ribosomal protein L19